MAKLFLVRHGQTEWNVEGRLQGSQDSALTELGLQQARDTGVKLRDYQFDAAYSSPRTRARVTAETILAGRDISLNEDARLREINLGRLEGMNKESLPEELKPAFRSFWKDPKAYQPVDGETFADARDRMVAGLLDLAKRHHGEQVLIVSHAAAIKLALCHIEGKDEAALWQPPGVDNGQLSCVEWSPEQGLRITLYNGQENW